ncbi:MAG: DAK2 domain-containing protein [Actinomycetota bacterium]
MSAVLDAGALRRSIEYSLADLRARRAEIDAANVYPVADSDTGTNLVMTMEAVVAALGRSGDGLQEVARAVRSGSLIGARGNSGVIMAQILRGLADAVEEGPPDVEHLARAFKRAAELAYEAVLEPAEGTILTVARAAADAAQGAHDDVAAQLVAAAKAAQVALDHTPEQMPTLAQAGVVDAGGMGLVVVLEAFARALGGDVGRPAPVASDAPDAPPPIRDAASSRYKYEVQYLLRTEQATLDPLRKLLGGIGDSVAVIGSDGLWRVHVHTDDRDRAVSLGEAFGETSRIEIVDFAEQIEKTNNNKAPAGERPSPEQPPTSPGVRGIPVARGAHTASLVAVTSGEGVARLYRELGAITVDGAARGTVTDEDLMRAIREAPSKEVIVLPNNDDVFWRLLELKKVSDREVHVLRSTDVGEGLAAAVAYGDARDTTAALRDMEAALARARTGVVVRASEAAETPAGPVEAGQSVGVADGAIVEVGDDPVEVARAVAKRLLDGERELLTVLCAEDVSADERERLRAALASEFGAGAVEIHDGGQPIHRYVLAAE